MHFLRLGSDPDVLEIKNDRFVREDAETSFQEIWLPCATAKQKEIDDLKAELEKAKAQAVPVWISTDFMKPDESDLVLGISTTKIAKFNVYQVVALDEFDECAINYWMPLPTAPSESGAEQ